MSADEICTSFPFRSTARVALSGDGHPPALLLPSIFAKRRVNIGEPAKLLGGHLDVRELSDATPAPRERPLIRAELILVFAQALLATVLALPKSTGALVHRTLVLGVIFRKPERTIASAQALSLPSQL